MTIIAATVNGTDWHSGWYNIPLFAFVLVALNKQMTCFGPITIDGTLYVDGQLIVEP